MVDIQISFSNLLAIEIAEKVILNIPDKDSLDISEFLSIIKEQEWGETIIENNHLKSSVVLIIDEEIIQFANPPDI
ncbi:MAG: hypothetical protein ACC656_05745, partial [Candidatus Heimdallarchaeota archaeon]